MEADQARKAKLLVTIDLEDRDRKLTELEATAGRR